MIGITVEKAHGEYDPGTSKFFGSPTMPEEWLEDGTIGDDDFFFCQLRLSEFKNLDKNNILPESGFIYIFLTENNGDFVPNVRYCATEPDTIIDDFNAGFDFLGDTDTEYSIDFFEAEADTDTSAIFITDNDSITLLKYDPLDDNMPRFLSETEKIAYFTITREDLKISDFSKVSLEIK